MPNTTIDLDRLTLKELQALYHDTFGKTTASRNRPWLAKKLKATLAAGAGLTEAAPKKATAKKRRPSRAKSDEKPSDKADADETPTVLSKAVAALGLEIGTTIEKTYKGRVVTLVIREHGFEVDGTLYKSLSAAAREIAGCNWNGHVFFGLKKRGGAQA
jgi:hypothetical protein